jgi:hypothetical protein
MFPITAAMLAATTPSLGWAVEPTTIWTTGCPALFIIGMLLKDTGPATAIPKAKLAANATILFAFLLFILPQVYDDYTIKRIK